jgi:hypothetical protein
MPFRVVSQSGVKMNFGNGLPVKDPQPKKSNSLLANLIPSKFEVEIDNKSIVTIAIIAFGAVVASKLT